KKLRRISQIFAHYRWSQIALRSWNLGWSRLQKNRNLNPCDIPAGLSLRNLDIAAVLAEIIVTEQVSSTDSIEPLLQQGKLTLLNHTVQIGKPVDWSAAGQQPRLWQFQLQYHEFLLPLAAGATGADLNKPELVQQIVDSWLDRYPPGQTRRSDDAWHPYCISRRIPVWTWLLATNVFTDHQRQRVVDSLFQQSCHLHANLEKDLGGNHLIENLVALAVAAVVLDTAQSKAWLQSVERELQRELDRQILPYGEHFELAPMYHCQILSNLLRIAWMCKKTAPRLSTLCRDHASKMFCFLQQSIHPDGEIALFGDSGFEEAPSVREICSVAAINGLSAKNEFKTVNELGPYWIFRDRIDDQADFLIFDRGPTAATDLPAHGHCDLLGFEASVAGKRWFVDSGNYNYQTDSMRSYCRSSLAHNVTTIDGLNQSEIWSSFRMGNRAQVLSSSSGQQDDFVWATGSINAYRPLKVQTLDRMIAVSATRKAWLCGDFADLSQADDSARLVGYLHLAPEVTVSQTGPDRSEYLLSDGHSTRKITFFNSTVKESIGWYCPSFGKRLPSPVFVYHCVDDHEPFGWIQQPTAPTNLTVKTSKKRLELRESSGSSSSPTLTTPVFDWIF
ncbi:MAG: putative heparinase superfamily protein, partial [Mariniblastus sp.]